MRSAIQQLCACVKSTDEAPAGQLIGWMCAQSSLAVLKDFTASAVFMIVFSPLRPDFLVPRFAFWAARWHRWTALAHAAKPEKADGSLGAIHLTHVHSTSSFVPQSVRPISRLRRAVIRGLAGLTMSVRENVRVEVLATWPYQHMAASSSQDTRRRPARPAELEMIPQNKAQTCVS